MQTPEVRACLTSEVHQLSADVTSCTRAWPGQGKLPRVDASDPKMLQCWRDFPPLIVAGFIKDALLVFTCV